MFDDVNNYRFRIYFLSHQTRQNTHAATQPHTDTHRHTHPARSMDTATTVGRADAVLLDDISEGAFLENLKKRYEANKIYSYIGEVLISVNPYRVSAPAIPTFLKKKRRIGITTEGGRRLRVLAGPRVPCPCTLRTLPRPSIIRWDWRALLSNRPLLRKICSKTVIFSFGSICALMRLDPTIVLVISSERTFSASTHTFALFLSLRRIPTRRWRCC